VVNAVQTWYISSSYTTSSSADPVAPTYDEYNNDVYVGGFGDETGTTMYYFS
jgi:hypothetical protein